MSSERKKHTGRILLWSGLGLLLLLGVLVRLLTTESAVQHRVQQALLQHRDPLPSPGRFVYANDSLVYWNRNDVNPRLMRRKVSVGTDTVCQLPTGTYHVHAYQQADTTTYEFSLLQNTPSLEDDTSHVFSKALYWTLLLPLALILIGLLLIFRKKQTQIKVGPGILVILIISILSTYIYSKTFTKRQNQNLRNMAERLVQKRDTRFELSYNGFAELVKTDTDFRDMVFAESNVLADLVLDYSKELLFDDNMNAYTVTLTLCAPHEEITLHPSGTVFECEAYFLDKLHTNKHQKVGEDLYFMDYYTLDPNYLGRIEVVSKDSLQRKTLYYEFYKPVAPEGFSLDYSVANYRDSLLVYKYGRYVYPNLVQSLKLNLDEFTYSKRYKHYAMRHGDNDLLVISAARKSWSEATAPFALFFLGLLLPYLLVVWLLNAQRPRHWRDRSFRQRLQSVILLTLGISFLAMGPVSVLYMRSLYNQKTADSQFETTLTLVNEMRNDVDFGSLLRFGSSDRWNDVLQRYANTFYTDINLYRLDGQLLATTRHEIFDNNLQAPLMNAEAYQSLHREQGLYFTHEEHLGQVVYESAYLPLTDTEGNLLAYLNTPFFSSRTDLQREIRNFVLTYLNIVLLLLGIALFFVLRLTQRLTQPLALIQDNLGRLKIDQKNEPIEWRSDDEIGALVRQYNQLIVELEKSAAELRRTAAESAWRGVARQVAHEIHNSLTPMRLSVQMLQRSAEQQDNAVAERIQRTSSTLLEQIDALSDIASSFSQYAKLPVNNPQPLDLAELVGNLVNLYDTTDNIRFSYEFDPAQDHTFNGDKTNLNSAIGNIIKNATQAIGTKADGRVEVKLKSTETSYVISVKDNGKGIKEEDKKMIFVPNFTTKTGGSGVGLSLTYNIIQSAGGSITFDSREGKGATFVITLPRS
ncbi:MAG: HAMP domain-containing histidine kinase [Bacteroidales bacterium]|nr:HAMP domain-containing histidine kinase [Bacteroidales bacterium]